MSAPIEWPTNLKVGIIRVWPADVPIQRLRSPYRTSGGKVVPIRQTVEELAREVRMLDGVNPTLLMALRPRDIRTDGRPRIDARPEHPGVIFTFETDNGTLSFPSGRWGSWEENLRAVVLTMEALRAPDRHGVVKHGQQYRGFLELESGIAIGTGINTLSKALDVLVTHAGMSLALNDSPATFAKAINLAKRRTHPDSGDLAANEDDFQKVMAAEQYLKQKGHLS